VQQILSSLASLATIAAGVAAVVGLTGVITNGARLRRTEAQWREVIQAETFDGAGVQLRLARDLQRHASAQLLARELVSSRVLAVMWLFGFMVAVVVGSLGFQFASRVISEPQAPWNSSLANVTGGGVLEILFGVVLLLTLLGEPLVVLVGLYSARRNIARAVLRNEAPINRLWSSDGFAYLLGQHLGARYLTLSVRSLGLTLTVAAACLATGTASRLVLEASQRGQLAPELLNLQLISTSVMIPMWMIGGLLAASLLTDPPALESPVVRDITTRALTIRRFADNRLRVGLYLPEPVRESKESSLKDDASSKRPRLWGWLTVGGLLLARRVNMRRF
jgi:hypothetical protein